MVVHFLNTWLTIVFYIDTGAMAARFYRSELNDQTLSSLAILPGTIRRIAYRKACILLLASLPGAIASTAVGLLPYWIYYSSGVYASLRLNILVQGAHACDGGGFLRPHGHLVFARS